MPHAETLSHSGHAGEDLLGHHGGVGQAFDLAQADVAGPAVGRVVGLVEMLGEVFVPAHGHAGITLHLAEVFQVGRGDLFRLLGLGGAFLHERFPAHDVGRRIQQYAFGLQPVAAGSARLLLVVLDRLRQRGVQHAADVAAVDAHAEGHRGHDHVQPLLGEGLLRAVPLVGLQSGVIVRRPQPRPL